MYARKPARFASKLALELNHHHINEKSDDQSVRDEFAREGLLRRRRVRVEFWLLLLSTNYRNLAIVK